MNKLSENTQGWIFDENQDVIDLSGVKGDFKKTLLDIIDDDYEKNNQVVICPNCGENYCQNGTYCEDCLIGEKNTNKLTIPKSSPKINLSKTKNKIDESILKEINNNSIFHIEDLEIKEGKIKNITFQKAKEKYVIYIEDYFYNISEHHESYGGNYDTVSLKNISYEKNNLAKVGKNGSNLEFHTMNYFKNLGGFDGINKFLRQVLIDFHKIKK
ncbi:MAG: hypothetical protein WC850_03860 [Candidatus Gracilibacteria bacterium]